MKPLVKVRPPGPKARKVVREDEKVIGGCLTRDYPLVIDKTSGVNIWDVDGNRYLDFGSSVAVMNFGYSNKGVIDAVKKQMNKASHVAFTDFYAEIPVNFAKKILSVLPKNYNNVFFTNSGAETIEQAMKLSRHFTKRKYFLSFFNSFHGRTYGALSLTASKAIQKQGFGPFLDVIHTPFPYTYRCEFVGHPDHNCGEEAIRFLEDEIFRKEVSPTEIAAVFVEPIQGEGGYIVPPKDFFKRLKRLCESYGILFVSDEIQSGCFRTGKFLAIENFGVQPDIVCLSKALGGGFPLGVTVTKKDIMTWKVCTGAYAGTFGGNLIACSAGNAALDFMIKNKLGLKAKKNGDYILKYLNELKDEIGLIGDVRGIGSMIGVELVKDKISKEPATEEMEKVIWNCFKNGLVLIPAGRSVIRICPPLIMERDDIDTGLEILTKSLKLISKK